MRKPSMSGQMSAMGEGDLSAFIELVRLVPTLDIRRSLGCGLSISLHANGKLRLMQAGPRRHGHHADDLGAREDVKITQIKSPALR